MQSAVIGTSGEGETRKGGRKEMEGRIGKRKKVKGIEDLVAKEMKGKVEGKQNESVRR